MAMAPEQMGIGIRRHFTEPGHAPVRHRRVGAARGPHPQLQGRHRRLLPARRRVPGHLVAERHQHRRPEVLPRHARHARARVVAAPGDRPGRRHDHRLGRARRLLRRRRRGRRPSATSSSTSSSTSAPRSTRPVWFNIGVKGVPQQASACFILAVDDTMDAILNWYREEGIIFKGGSGSGINLSGIRSSVEPLQGGGTASGPVSFMRGADASAGTIKSGGKTRRAAKMVILNADHPDVEEFIWCKAHRGAQGPRAARGRLRHGPRRQATATRSSTRTPTTRCGSPTSSCRRCSTTATGTCSSVTTGEPVRTVKARELMRQISEAAWECADPGMQFDTTINRWHTAPNTGRINAIQPVLASTCTSTTRRATSPASTC